MRRTYGILLKPRSYECSTFSLYLYVYICVLIVLICGVICAGEIYIEFWDNMVGGYLRGLFENSTDISWEKRRVRNLEPQHIKHSKKHGREIGLGFDDEKEYVQHPSSVV